MYVVQQPPNKMVGSGQFVAENEYVYISDQIGGQRESTADRRCRLIRNGLLAVLLLVVIVVLTSAAIKFVWFNNSSTTAAATTATAAQQSVELKQPDANSAPNPSTTTESPKTQKPASAEQVESARRADVVRSMTMEAWSLYKRHAWGHHELQPLTKAGLRTLGHWAGLNIVAALTTLHVMSLPDEFREGRDWVERNLRPTENGLEYQSFELLTWMGGSLLSCYALTGDAMFAAKGREIAEALAPGYRSKTGLPYKYMNPTTGAVKNATTVNAVGDVIGGQMELRYLSAITGDPVFRDRAIRTHQFFAKLLVDPRNASLALLPGNEIDVTTGEWTTEYVQLGWQRDWTEGLLLVHLQSGGMDQWSLAEYVKSVEALDRAGLFVRSRTGLLFPSRQLNRTAQSPVVTDEMFYSECYIGSVLALGARALEQSLTRATVIGFEQKQRRLKQINHHWRLAREVTETCHQAEVRSRSGLPPESIYFSAQNDASNSGFGWSQYALSGEAARSYLYLWRLTREQKYRDYAWHLVEAIEKHCHLEHGGYAGVYNVNEVPLRHRDYQNEYFFSSTLKYLYLTFVDDQNTKDGGDLNRTLPVDRWLLTRPGHALPVMVGH